MYYEKVEEKVILASNGDLLPEDAGALIAEDERMMEEAQAKISAAMQAEVAAAPMAKPEGGCTSSRQQQVQPDGQGRPGHS